MRDSDRLLYLFPWNPMKTKKLVFPLKTGEDSWSVCIRLPENMRIEDQEDDWPDFCVDIEPHSLKIIRLVSIW